MTNIISDISEKRFKTELKIRDMSLSVFPPGIEFNDVDVVKRIDTDHYVDAEFGKIGIYLGLIELEEKNITLGEIRISDSYIKYIGPENKDELKEIDQKLIDKIFKIPDQMPIRLDTIIVENTKIFFNYDMFEAKRLKLYKKDTSFITRFHFAHIRPDKKSTHTIDEIWGDGEISKKNISIHRVKIQQDVQTLLIKGEIKDYYKLKGSKADLNGEMNVYLPNLLSNFSPSDKLQINQGSGRVGFRVSYSQGEIKGDADVFLKEIDSNIISATEIRTLLKLENSKIKVNLFSLENTDESLDLLTPFEVYDLEKHRFPEINLSMDAKNLHLTNILKYLGPSFKTLKGELNGKLSLYFNKNNLRIIPEDKFIINNLGLVTGEGKSSFKVLMVKRAVLSKTSIGVNEDEFQLETDIELKNSKLNVQGFVNKNAINFKVPDAKIDLADFGNISNLGIKGAGTLSVNVTGPPKDTKINITGKTEGFEILGYHLDRSDKNITINLGDSTVEIDKLDSIIGKTRISGNGSVNYKDADIAIGISSNDVNSGDLIQILDPIAKSLPALPDDLDFKAKIDVDIFGKYHFKDLKIRSRVDFNDLTLASETINSGSFDLSLLNKVISVKNIECIKGRGSLDGDLLYDLSDKSFNLKFFWENFELQSFQFAKKIGLNIDTLISGKLTGGGAENDYKLKLESTAFDTHAANYKFDDSNFDIFLQPKRIKGRANFLGNILKSDFNFGLARGSHSDLDLQFKVDNLKPFLVAIFGNHLENESFSGNFNFVASASFDYGFTNFDLEATLNNLLFSHPEFNINYKSTRPEFLVKESKILRWSLFLKQPDIFIETRGDGTFGKRVSMIQEFHVNSKILEIISSKILSSEGFIRNVARINGNGPEFDFSLSSKTNDLDLSIEQLPVQVNDLKYDIEYANNRLQIQNLNSSLDNGTFSLKGDVFFDGNHPDVNLKFILDKAEIPIVGDSSFNISGEGIVLGNNYPYTLGGEIVINKGNIVEELNEFSSKSAAFSQVRFLPRNQESVLGKMFSVNLNVKAENPVRISNSLMDVAFVGEIRLTGNPSRPRAEGRLSSPINSSRIFFKNNEYQIISADINFSPKKEITNPDFDIQALTIISNYKIYPKAYGDLERFNFDLTSEPVLPRNSILSLIAFGYTDEIQTALYAKDQRSLTQVGVGSFVFDRFKISDILNKQFGLQVNLGTVIEQSSTDSLLSGRSQSRGSGQTAGALGRTRSATKIELKKRLDEALTLSVSSTMGGSIGQRQSMNLNYGLTKNIQLEGVYELRTNEEGEADIIYNSIGGDLKFRRTFK